MIGYINELLFTPELDYLPTILPTLKPEIRSANLIAQLNAMLAGSLRRRAAAFSGARISTTRADPAGRNHDPAVVLSADV